MKLKPYLFALAVGIIISTSLLAQELPSRSRRAVQAFNQAKEHFRLRMYAPAIESLEEAVDRDPEYVDAYLLLAQIYYETDSSLLQVKYLDKAIELAPNYFPPAYINRAEGNMLLGKYYEALDDIVYFNDKYGHSYSQFRPLIELLLNKALFAVESVKNPVSIQLTQLPQTINTQSDEYWPSFTVDNKQFYYTLKSDLGRNRFREDIWTCRVDNNGYSEAKPVGTPVNSEFNEGASFISPDGRYILFTGCNRQDGFGSCDIYLTVYSNGEWLKPKNLGKTVNSPFWESRPVISSDGTQLYFASNRPGGIGKSDLYMSRLKGFDNEGFPVWDKPTNLGPIINTEGDEMSPFIHPDNVTLYFASNYYPGLGRFDIYKTQLVEGKWTKPVNLGYPINTNGSELGIFVQSNGKKAFIDKEVGATRQRDIFCFDLPQTAQAGKVTYVKGVVIDKETREPLSAQIDLNNFETPDSILSIKSDNKGNFLIALIAGKTYGLTVDKTSYLFYSSHFAIDSTKIEAFEITVELEPLKVGKKTILNNVFFETDSYVITPTSQTELNKVVKLMKQNPTIKIEISGHTDDTGAGQHNMTLSENRAQSVFNYIKDSGIAEERLTYKGYGANNPIAPNNDNAGRAKNRRTEMKIIGR